MKGGKGIWQAENRHEHPEPRRINSDMTVLTGYLLMTFCAQIAG